MSALKIVAFLINYDIPTYWHGLAEWRCGQNTTLASCTSLSFHRCLQPVRSPALRWPNANILCDCQRVHRLPGRERGRGDEKALPSGHGHRIPSPPVLHPVRVWGTPSPGVWAWTELQLTTWGPAPLTLVYEAGSAIRLLYILSKRFTHPWVNKYILSCILI